MSDKAGVPREWRCYIHDMIRSCEQIETWTRGLDRDGLTADDMTCAATLRNLQLIGRAAARVPGAIRDAHPEIPWRTVIDARDRLAYIYPGMDADTVWSIVRNDVPALPPALRGLLVAHDRGSGI